MKKKNKNIILICILAIIIIIAIIYILTTKNNKTQTENQAQNETANIISNDNKFSEKKEYSDLEIQYTKAEKNEDNQTNFTFTIKNNKQEKYPGGYARIELLDKNNSEIGNLIIYIPEIEQESSVEVNASTDMNIDEIFDYKIVSSEAS